tara:strand:+ start:945 stop:1079 length:135 start_codon:yes stop_codon:yes gene_type:complete
MDTISEISFLFRYIKDWFFIIWEIKFTVYARGSGIEIALKHNEI